MNYLIRSRAIPLAAEYVLGTLSPNAQRRFLKLLLLFPRLRPIVWKWEQQFVLLSDEVLHLPPPELKQQIFNRIGISKSA